MHVRAPPLGFVLIAKVTLDVSVVTVLPLASRIVTTGCVDRLEPPVPLPGWVVKTNCVAKPAVMLKALLVLPAIPDPEELALKM